MGAFIRVRPGYEGMTEEDVRAFAIPRIARYKVPKRVFFVDDFPMTPSMEVQKFKLREMAEDWCEQASSKPFFLGEGAYSGAALPNEAGGRG